MADTKLFFELSSKGKKYYKINEHGSYFDNYRDGLLSGEHYEEIGKARTYDDAITICRTHTFQFGKIETMSFR